MGPLFLGICFFSGFESIHKFGVRVVFTFPTFTSFQQHSMMITSSNFGCTIKGNWADHRHGQASWFSWFGDIFGGRLFLFSLGMDGDGPQTRWT